MTRIGAALPCGGPDWIRLTVPELARVTVRIDGDMEVKRAPGVEASDLLWLLGGPARQALDLLRGRFSLRASAVVIGGGAIALLGPVAGGKSLIAAALAQRGWPVLCDAALPVTVAGEILAHPVSEPLALWPAAAKLLNLDPAQGRPVRPRLEKRGYAFPAAGAPARLAGVMIVGASNFVTRLSVEPIRGADRATGLRAATALYPLVGPTGQAAEHFRWVGRLAGVPMHAVAIRPGRDHLADVVSALEALAGGP